MTFTPEQLARRREALREFTKTLAAMDDKTMDEALEHAWSEQKADDASGWLWISCLAAAKANRLEGVRTA